MKFLIDECLSLDLVTAANDAGYEAQHIVRIGKAGWMDWNVTAYANDGDFTLVINNARDFRELYSHQLLHSGLIIIIPSASLALQRQLFLEVLATLKIMREPINQVIEVDLDGDEVKISVYDLPPSIA